MTNEELIAHAWKFLESVKPEWNPGGYSDSLHRVKKEIERLRAENAELREDNADVHAMLQRGLMLMEAQLELDWFRRLEQQIKAQADTRHLGAQLLTGYLAEYERANPKPGAGT